MIPVLRGPRRRLSRLWACLVTVQILICLGTGLVSIVLPDDSNLPAGYYDGDGDDAVTTPERLGGVVDLTLDARAVVLPVEPPSVSSPPPSAHLIPVGCSPRFSAPRPPSPIDSDTAGLQPARPLRPTGRDVRVIRRRPWSAARGAVAKARGLDLVVEGGGIDIGV